MVRDNGDMPGTERVVRSAGTSMGYYLENALTAVVVIPLGVIALSVLAGLINGALQYLAWAMRAGQPSGGVFGAFISALPVLFLIGMLIGMVFLVLRAASVKYVLTDQRLMVSHGVLSRSAMTVPLEQIQDIRYRQPFLGRVLGYGFVMAQTASTYGQVTLRYVAEPSAWVVAIDDTARALRSRPATVATLPVSTVEPLAPGPDLLNPSWRPPTN